VVKATTSCCSARPTAPQKYEFEFRVTGTLRHFKEGEPPEIVAKADVVAGLYRVGDAVLSLAKLAPVKVTTEPGNPNWLIVWTTSIRPRDLRGGLASGVEGRAGLKSPATQPGANPASGEADE
jgi:hypothetical protein